MRLLPLALLAVTTLAHAAPPALDPASLFDGRSQGEGTLRLFGRSRHYVVDNVGHRDADGTFVLAQTIRMDGEPVRQRTWRIRAAGMQRFEFTLSDAMGPGVAHVDGEALRLRYAAKHSVRVAQVLTWTHDGRIDNHGRIRMLGVPIGRLDETITRVQAEQVTGLARTRP